MEHEGLIFQVLSSKTLLLTDLVDKLLGLVVVIFGTSKLHASNDTARLQ